MRCALFVRSAKMRMRRFEYLRRAAHSRRDMRGDDADSHVFVLSLAIPTARGTRHLVPRFALLCFLPKGPTRRGRPLPATYDTLRCLRELRLRGRGIHSTAPKPQWHSRRTEHATRKCIVKRPRVPPSARQRARVGFDSPIAGENCEPVVGGRAGGQGTKETANARSSPLAVMIRWSQVLGASLVQALQRRHRSPHYGLYLFS